MLNLDANASYGGSSFVVNELLALGINFHNPSSVHSAGQKARALIEEARERVARLLNVGKDSRVVFTSGATESNNTILRSLAKDNLLVSSIEHPSVLECARDLKRKGVKIHELKYARGITQESLLKAITTETKLVSVMWVNNETGEILPIPAIVSALRLFNSRIYVHSDAVQAVGRLEIDFERSGLDALTISGHKIGALPGVGALVINKRIALDPLLFGGSQELHHRAGTENVIGIVSMGLAALDERVSRLFS
jgi:cysteine desulfurase